MELKEGYKNTEIGAIPMDWEVRLLSQISTFENGKAHEQYIVEDSDFIVVNSKFISTDGEVFKFSKVALALLNVNDIAMVMSDIPNGKALAKCFIVKEKNKFTLNQRICSIKSTDVDSDFLYRILNRNKYFLAYDSGTGQTNLRKQEVLNCPIPLPPTKAEQLAIATALSDMDALITSLEKLIDKTKAIKQGAMQELLKPKEGWVVKKLGEIGKTYGGLSGKTKIDFSNGKYPYIPFMNIMSNSIIDINYFDYVNIRGGEIQNKAAKGDLFFNGSSETPEEVGMCSVLLENVSNLYLNSFCFGFRLFDSNSNSALYLSYFFRSNEGRKLFYSMAQGATRYNLSKANFNSIEIALPDFSEQVRISEILNNMEREIMELNKFRFKYTLLKQGMMQELLTGKTRLI